MYAMKPTKDRPKRSESMMAFNVIIVSDDRDLTVMKIKVSSVVTAQLTVVSV